MPPHMEDGVRLPAGNPNRVPPVAIGSLAPHTNLLHHEVHAPYSPQGDAPIHSQLVELRRHLP